MKIKLNNGLYAEIDEKDYELIARFKWHIQVGTNSYYAKTTVYQNGKFKCGLWMHRFIMGLENGNPFVVDHKDGNGLNNRRNNLIICSRAINNKRRFNILIPNTKDKLIVSKDSSEWTVKKITEIEIARFKTQYQAKKERLKIICQFNKL